MTTFRLHPDDIQALAGELARQLHVVMIDKDPELNRVEAAKFCRLSVREFDRERGRYPKLLLPARARRPLLWRRSTLEIYRSGARVRPDTRVR